MFTLPKKSTEEILPPTTGKTTIIGTGMIVTGEIIADGDIRIDGKLVGNVKCAAKVVVGETGVVEGNIDAYQGDITGKVTGNLNIKEQLSMRQSAVVNGDLYAEKISLEPTVIFNGRCSMKQIPETSVVEISKKQNERKAAEQ